MEQNLDLLYLAREILLFSYPVMYLFSLDSFIGYTTFPNSVSLIYKYIMTICTMVVMEISGKGHLCSLINGVHLKTTIITRMPPYNILMKMRNS